MARSWLGQQHPLFVNGEAREGSGYKEARSPIDGTRDRRVRARARARTSATPSRPPRRAFHDWADRPWQERVAIIRKAADIMSRAAQRAVGADGDGGRQEPARGARRRRGVGRPASAGTPTRSSRTTGSASRCSRSARRASTTTSCGPYGVWAVISPFNFPMALAGGPVVRRARRGQHASCSSPRTWASFTGLKLYEIYMAAGVPKGAFHFLTGPGQRGRRRDRQPPRTSPGSRSPARTRSGWGSTRTSRRTSRSR